MHFGARVDSLTRAIRVRHRGVGYAEAHAMVHDLEVSAQLQLPAGTNTNIVCSPVDPENV